MQSHEIDYKIIGDDLQFVEIELDFGETVIGEAGAMMYMEEGISFEAKMGDGSKPNQGVFDKLMDAGKRMLSNESVFMTHFTAQKQGKSHIAFAAPYPGKIIPIDLKKVRGRIICQKSAFLCAAKGTNVSIEFAKRFGAGLFGGEGFILQKLTGDGRAFIHACGGVYLRKIENETLKIDSGCIVAFTEGLDFNIEVVKGLKTMFFGGESMFMTTLSGNGYVWLQSLPFSRLADRIIQASGYMGGKKSGEQNAMDIIEMFTRR